MKFERIVFSSKHYLFHILGWILFIGITYMLRFPINEHVLPPSINGIDRMTKPPLGIHFGPSMLFVILILYFYFNRRYLLPELLFRQKTLKFFIVSIAIFLFVVYLPYFIYVLSPHMSDQSPPPISKVHFLTSVINFIFVFIASTSLPLIKRWIISENYSVAIQNQNLQTEIALLKSQISPHFLFNTLNNIYSLAIHNNELAADSIMKLSQILRYLLEEGQQDRISLGKEIDHLKEFVALNKLRTSDTVLIKFESSIQNPEITIAPLLFLPLVENAFKYGISSRESSFISFEIINENNSLVFSASNTIVNLSSREGQSTGMGLENVKKRLGLLYPDNHLIEVSSSNNIFNVSINLFNL